MTDADTRAPATLSERLDRLPFTRRHLRVLTGSGLGWALDAMDVGLISFVIAALAALAVGFGLYIAYQESQRPALEIRVDEGGIKIDGNG